MFMHWLLYESTCYSLNVFMKILPLCIQSSVSFLITEEQLASDRVANILIMNER